METDNQQQAVLPCVQLLLLPACIQLLLLLPVCIQLLLLPVCIQLLLLPACIQLLLLPACIQLLLLPAIQLLLLPACIQLLLLSACIQLLLLPACIRLLPLSVQLLTSSSCAMSCSCRSGSATSRLCSAAPPPEHGQPRPNRHEGDIPGHARHRVQHLGQQRQHELLGITQFGQ